MTTPTGKTLHEFLTGVAAAQDAMRRAGLVNVYFVHCTLTPGNIRRVWDDTPTAQVPAVGAVVDLPGAGYMGADARWRVTGREWLKGPGVVLTMSDTTDD